MLACVAPLIEFLRSFLLIAREFLDLSGVTVFCCLLVGRQMPPKRGI